MKLLPGYYLFFSDHEVKKMPREHVIELIRETGLSQQILPTKRSKSAWVYPGDWSDVIRQMLLPYGICARRDGRVYWLREGPDAALSKCLGLFARVGLIPVQCRPVDVGLSMAVTLAARYLDARLDNIELRAGKAMAKLTPRASTLRRLEGELLELLDLWESSHMAATESLPGRLHAATTRVQERLASLVPQDELLSVDFCGERFVQSEPGGPYRGSTQPLQALKSLGILGQTIGLGHGSTLRLAIDNDVGLIWIDGAPSPAALASYGIVAIEEDSNGKSEAGKAEHAADS